MRKAVCLYSGGLDSTTCLYQALRDGYEVIALTLHYGQIHQKEIELTRQVCALLKMKHHVVSFGLPWKGSALLDSSVGIPKKRTQSAISAEIPATYVPARNSIFLSLASSCAEAEKAEAIYIGVNALDYSGYPDCRPDFLEAFRKMIEKGTKAGVEGHTVKIVAPLIDKTKKDIVLLARELHVPLEKTWSCYSGGTSPCGECDSCILRAKGFEEAGLLDPVAV